MRASNPTQKTAYLFDKCACGQLKRKTSKNCYRCARPLQSGTGHPQWKGGKHMHNGYVRLIIDGRYVLEHRIVMEQELGRPLFPDERVHHRNGDRMDNRPENLELWSISQPPGQRVSDKVKWAEEILDRYKGQDYR